MNYNSLHTITKCLRYAYDFEININIIFGLNRIFNFKIKNRT